MPFDLEAAVKRAWFRVAPGYDELESRLYLDEMQACIDDALADVGHEIALDPRQAPILERQYTIPVVTTPGQAGTASLRGPSNGASPPTADLIPISITLIFHRDSGGILTRMRQLKDEFQLYRPQPTGILWWVLHEYTITTLDFEGRGPDDGNTLDGDFLVHANYMPVIQDFDDIPELQRALVTRIEAYARKRLQPQFAAALADELRTV